jgi:hypothetical protein
MTTLAAQLHERFTRQSLFGKTLSQCVTLAQSVGVLADQGKRYTIKHSASSAFVGAVQVGEYVQTGKVPAAALVLSVLEVVE